MFKPTKFSPSRLLPQHSARSFILLILLLLGLVASLESVKHVKNYLSRAAYKPADIRINLKVSPGPLKKSWQAFAQGGESPEPMLSPVTPQLKALNPQYIRLDHIFDFYVDIDTTTRPYHYNFSRLDRVLREVTATGAIPFIALSYTPPALASGTLVSPPNSYADWADLVTATINHISGRDQLNLSKVYYEVWNEPDLFGGYKPGYYPDYLTLYQSTAQAAQQASNTNQFYLGGPATTDYYPNWISPLLELSQQQDLPLDFISFHLYNADDNVFKKKVFRLRNQLQLHPKFADLPILITEWGSDSENSTWHDSNFDAIHSLAVISRVSQQLDWLFSFELVDGLSDSITGRSSALWGRWGLLTHPNYGAAPKPRYYVYPFLNQLQGQLLAHSGDGSHVSALASQPDPATTQVLLVNFSSQDPHQELVPLTLLNLPAGEYRLTHNWFGSHSSDVESFISTGQSYFQQILLPPQSAVILTIEQTGQVGQFAPGHLGQALLAAEPFPVISWPSDELSLGGSISFWTKPAWPSTSSGSHEWLSGPLASGSTWRVTTKRNQSGRRLYCGQFAGSDPKFTVSADISTWSTDTWQHITCRFYYRLGLSYLELYLNDSLIDRASQLGSLLFTGPMSLSSSDTYIDELTVSKLISTPTGQEEATIFSQSFDQ